MTFLWKKVEFLLPILQMPEVNTMVFRISEHRIMEKFEEIAAKKMRFFTSTMTVFSGNPRCNGNFCWAEYFR